MATDITVDAVRLALGLQQLRAEVASGNIAHGNAPGHQVQRVEMAGAQALLRQAAMPGANPSLFQNLASLSPSDVATVVADPSVAAAQPDSQVAEMVAASLDFQSLAESLNRHFGLMRLAVSGRSGA